MPVAHRPLALACCLVVLAACTGDGGDAAPPTADTSAATRAPAAEPPATGRGDGVYRIGVLVPAEGEPSEIGRGVVRGVNLAVGEVNEAGGIAGLPVEVVLRDEPTDPVQADRVVRALIEEDRIDGLVGPASSSVALAVLERLVDANVLTCSPTATASDLSAYPDNGLFFRTIGSERAEAVALAEVVQASGEGSAAVLYPDDDYGTEMAELVVRALPDSVDVVGREAYDTTATAFGGPTNRLLDLDPATVVVLGSGNAGARVIASVLDRADRATRLFVGSGLRSSLLTELVSPGAPQVLDGVEGVSPRARGNDRFAEVLAAQDSEAPTAFAAQAYDCVNLMAIAAHQAGGDNGLAAAALLRDVSEVGSPCRGFAACADLLDDGRAIDLEGASGPLSLDDAGDVRVAIYDRFRYRPDGSDRTIATVTVTLGVPVT